MPRMRRNRSSVAVAIQPAVRCAIYTRKSTDEGLDRDFNSLDAQRQAAESFIESQRGEGWQALPDQYDDGGFSGATTDRPALKQLLADAEAGKVDCVVIYKLDRLSRNVRDYLNLLALLETHGVDFVSVTQQFNTTTPVGRMTLRMLLSFAEFERDIIAERTRDKMQAARRRGKWTGGRPILGYDTAPEGGRLVVNRDESAQVVAIFEMYDVNPSQTTVVRELRRRGWTQKKWTTKTGNTCGGSQWTRSSLRTLLSNPLYAGRQRLGDETFKGDHDRIVPKKLWDRVQQLLEGKPRRRSSPNGSGYLLRGLLRCAACDSAMTPHGTTRKGRAYRYYTCSRSQKSGDGTCPKPSVQADRVEQFVVDQIRRIGADPNLQNETFRQAVAQVKAQRRGMRAEAKRIERDLVTVRSDVGRLVDTLSRTNGPAADAVAIDLEKTQERVTTLESRQGEVREEIAVLKAQEIDRNDLTQALGEFDPIWNALLNPERERVMKLLIDRIGYHGGTKQMAITWRLAGFGQLADEVAP